MTPISTHYVDHYPAIAALLETLTPNLSRDRLLADYRALTVAYDVVRRQLAGIPDQAEETLQRLIGGDGAAGELLDRFTLLAMQRTYLPALMHTLTVRMGQSQAPWAILAREHIERERKRRRGICLARADALEETRQRRRRLGGSRPVGAQFATDQQLWDELTAELATLDPLIAHEEVPRILGLFDAASRQRFTSADHINNDKDLGCFVERVPRQVA